MGEPYAVKSSGLLTASGVVYAGPCIVWGLEVTSNSAATAVVIGTVIDTATTNITGKVRASQLKVPGPLLYAYKDFNAGVMCSQGAYVSFSTSQMKAILYYSPV